MPAQKTLLLPKPQGDYVLERAYPIPTPGKDEVLVKVKSAAINPADYWVKTLSPSFVPEFPTVTGFDIAGEVVKLGEGVTKFRVGDRVFFAGSFGPKYGGFQEYTIADVDTTAILPSTLTFDDGSTLSVSLATGYIALYSDTSLGLGLKSVLTPGGIGAYAGRAIFVAAGSSSSGVGAIQLAKLSGFTYIITTSSLHNTGYLKSFGATHVLDRKLSPEQIVGELEKIEGLPSIEHAFDAYGDENTSFAAAVAALAPGGRVATVSSVIGGSADALPNAKTKSTFSAVKFNPQSRVYYIQLFAGITKLLEEQSIKPARSEVLPGGLIGVDEGLRRIEKGQISGVKLVIHPEETI